jgi:RNA polymerase sigma factor (sigma-70 family)
MPPGSGEHGATPVESTAQLIERARSGDQAALDALFARYLLPLRRWASGRLPGWARDLTDTQDLVQDVLLQTFRRLGDFEPRGEGALQGYLRQALRNRLLDELRRVQRRPAHTLLDSQREDEAPSPLEAAIGQEGIERYERALAALRAEEREAVVARIELGYSYPEIAEMLDKPSPDAARMTVGRALARLVQEMSRGA